MSKTIDKSIHYQWEDYLKKSGLLHKTQSGVRANILTDSYLAHLTDFVFLCMVKKIYTDIIFIDLQKTLDTLDQKLEKMACLIFKTSVIKMLWVWPIK